MANTVDTRRIIAVTHGSIVLYAMCFWVQIGTLPYLTKQLDIDPITFGYLQTTFAAVQLMGGPIFGRFGDLKGSKSALLLAFSASILSYTILGFAQNVFMLFLSRLPSLCMHAMQGAQMVITDISDSQTRSENLGKLGISYGIGMVIGPILGGQTMKYAGEQTAAYVSALGSILALFLVYNFLPKYQKDSYQHHSDSDNVSRPISAGSTKKGIFDLNHILTLLSQNTNAKILLIVKSLSGIPIGVLHSMFSILAMNHFNLSAEINGYVLSYVGVVSMISQGLIVGRISKLGFDEWTIIKGSVFIICLGYLLLLTTVYGVITFCVALFPMVVAGAVFSTILNSMLTKSVASQDTGTMLGISMAVNSMIRIVGPTFGGIMLKKFGFPSFGILGLLFNVPLFMYMNIQRP